MSQGHHPEDETLKVESTSIENVCFYGIVCDIFSFTSVKTLFNVFDRSQVKDSMECIREHTNFGIHGYCKSIISDCTLSSVEKGR